MSPELIGVLLGGVIGLATSAMGHLFAWFQLKSSRAFGLRQEIYVESAAAMANALQFFSKAADLNVNDNELAQFIGPATVAMFKIHVVASPSTISALSAANQTLTIAAIDLSVRRTMLRLAMATVPQSQTLDAPAPARVNQLQKDLLVEALQASLRYQRHLTEVNISARRELGLALDESQYRSANLEAERAISAAIEQAINKAS